MPHPTRLIRHADFEAEVDERLAGLVLALWRAGIETASACQDEAESQTEVGGDVDAAARHRGRSYVDFLSLDDALRFYDIVANAGPANELYDRMSNLATPGAWEARVALFDTRVTSGTGDLSEPSAFSAGVVRVRFPADDAGEITYRLSKASKGT